MLIYLLPFWLSSHFGGEVYGENGLYLVYRENVLRYFKPFDHRGPIYTYFIYLPLYLLPWTLFFIPALCTLPTRWSKLTMSARWNVWAFALIFLFFTLSGSRRSYYVLPIVPFAILMTADWLYAVSAPYVWRQRLAALCAVISAVAIFIIMDLGPAWYYAQCGVERFAVSLKREAEKQKPWASWHVVMLDAETKLNFYLQLPPDTKNYDPLGDRAKQTEATLHQAWPVLKQQEPGTIIISRKLYAPVLDKTFPQYTKVSLPTGSCSSLQSSRDENMPIAYIPSQ
jgi:hypothetical protein